MLHRVALAATLSLVALGFQAIPAAAEIDASGTRLSIAGGAPRFYMTYGHFADTELYAPVMQPLRRAGVTFQRVEDDYILYIRGQKTQERWAIVRSRDEVPETGEPCILELGGQTYVPLKSVIRLAKLPFRWEKGSNQVVINTPTEGPGPRLNPSVTVRADLQGVVLAGVSVEQKGAALQLRIRTTGAVEPRSLRVTSDGLPRLCLDFGGARWADKLVLPAAMGDLRAIRVGYPPNTGAARLAVEVPSKDFNITNVQVDRDEVVATISRGIQYRSVAYTSEAKDDLAIRRRRKQILVANSRGGGGIGTQEEPLDGNVLRPVQPPLELPGGPEFDNSRFNPVANLSGRNIVVDAGHGGRHAGAKGLYNLEKDLCLKMAIELQQALESRGANVIMTRTSDVFVSLDARCQVANRSGADIFISIHCNSMPRRNMQSGSETYWHSSEQSRRLARALHPRLVRAVKGRDGGIRNRSFQVIRETNMPSVLLEIAYINNTLDEQLLADTTFHGRLAESLAQGVLDYFGKEVQ